MKTKIKSFFGIILLVSCTTHLFGQLIDPPTDLEATRTKKSSTSPNQFKYDISFTVPEADMSDIRLIRVKIGTGKGSDNVYNAPFFVKSSYDSTASATEYYFEKPAINYSATDDKCNVGTEYIVRKGKYVEVVLVDINGDATNPVRYQIN